MDFLKFTAMYAFLKPDGRFYQDGMNSGWSLCGRQPWLAVLERACLKIKHPDIPLPQVQRLSEVAEFHVGMEVKLAEVLGSRPATGTGELLPVDPEGVAEV